MTIAAGMNNDPARRRACEVMGLDQSSAGKIPKRRLKHPSVANRNQILQPVLVRLLDERDNVALLALSENDFTMRTAWALLPEGLACLPTLFFAGNLVFCHVIQFCLPERRKSASEYARKRRERKLDFLKVPLLLCTRKLNSLPLMMKRNENLRIGDRCDRSSDMGFRRGLHDLTVRGVRAL